MSCHSQTFHLVLTEGMHNAREVSPKQMGPIRVTGIEEKQIRKHPKELFLLLKNKY